jgi:hypothetical protein
MAKYQTKMLAANGERFLAIPNLAAKTKNYIFKKNVH